MPYQFNITRRRNHQFGAGAVALGASKPRTLSETLLDAIPGGLVWVSLIVVFWLAVKAPLTMIMVAACLSAYTTTRFFFAAIAVLIGLRKVAQWEKIDWQAEYKLRAKPDSLPLEAVHHLVIIPNYREEIEVLRVSLQRLAEQTVARDQVTICMAMESGEDAAAEKGETLRREFPDCFADFMFAVHPKGLAQEMQCKSANEAWATRHAKREMVDEGDYELQNIVVTTMDADTLWHPQYLEALGVLFATDSKRYNAFWQAPIRYHSNVWDINPFMRLMHAYSTCWELAYLAAPWWQGLPMSSYSLSLKLLDTVGYWDPDVIADEWHMYIKAFFHRDGDLVLRPIFLPFSGNATGGKTIIESVKQRYDQTLRHAWGAKEIGYTIALSQNHPQIGLGKRFSLLFRVSHDNLLAGAGWVILTLGVQLPSLLHAGQVSEWVQSPAFYLLQICGLLVIALTIFFWAVDVRTRPPRKQEMTRPERIMSAISLPSLPLITLICLAIPVLHSQTRLMLGMPLQFRVTRKFFV